MENQTNTRPDEHDEDTREPYSKPIVTCYGDVAEITKGGNGTFADTAGEGSVPF